MAKTTFGPEPKNPKKPATASKFLPFITNKSTPLATFKALIQRSKGVSNENIAAVFSTILCLGIDALKDKVKTLPEEYTGLEIINFIVMTYPQFKMQKSKLLYWEYVLKNYGIDNIVTNTDYSRAEIIILFTCLAEHKKEYLADIGFDGLNLDYLSQFSNDTSNLHIQQLPINFDDNAERIGFKEFEEFKAYVAFLLAKDNSTVYTFYPVYVNEFSSNSYAKSPYPSEEKENEVTDYTKGECDVPF